EPAQRRAAGGLPGGARMSRRARRSRSGRDRPPRHGRGDDQDFGSGRTDRRGSRGSGGPGADRERDLTVERLEQPKEQWKTLRTTNTIERLHEEFRRRVKTQSSLPTEDLAVILLFSLVASGQIRLRRVDGWQKIATVLSQN